MLDVEVVELPEVVEDVLDVEDDVVEPLELEEDVFGETTTNGEKEFVTPVIVFELTFTFVVIFFQTLFSKCQI